MSSEEKIDQLEKRLQSLEKQMKIKLTEFDDYLCQTIRKHLSELYFYIAREIKNEADIDTVKEFLIEKGYIDYKEYLSFRTENKLMKTYVDENINAISVHDIFQKEGANPTAEINCVSYVNNSNQIIFKHRLQLKKELALKRGLDKGSEHINEIDEMIKNLQDQINERYSKNTQSVKENGNFNASIILLSVFMESFLKEKYYFKNNRITEDTLNPLIDTCFRENIVDESEKAVLKSFAETVRNIYIHSNFHKIIPDVTTQACRIDFNNSSNTELTYVTAKDLPTLRDIQKLEQDKEASRNLIIKMLEITSNIEKRFCENFKN